MSRAWACLVVVTGLVPAVIGCAPHERYPAYAPANPPTAALLFDDRPGPLSSDDFALRAEWPTSPRPFDYSESIYFIDFTYDLEGVFGADQDRMRRYFRSYRIGFGYR